MFHIARDKLLLLNTNHEFVPASIGNLMCLTLDNLVFTF